MHLRKFSMLFMVFAALSNALTAQLKEDYPVNWKKVAEYEKKGLTKSALQEVIAIYQLAVKDNNDAQQIKSSMYQVKYRNMVEEDSREKTIFFVDSLIEKASAPARNILQSMQAEMFWRYVQVNRYKFYNRTKLSDDKNNDISTWSLDKLYSKISTLYKRSLEAGDLLKKTRLNQFDPIIEKGQHTRQLRPTLFDFLAHRALEFFMNDERDLLKPAYSFTIDDPAVFSPVNGFVQATFRTRDSTSLHHQAILLFQQVLLFHLKDTNVNALLDADLSRLRFMHGYAVNENKTKLYEAALKTVEQKYSGNAGVAEAMFLRAGIYYDRGQDFEPLKKTENQYEIKRAKELCEEVIKKYPNSEGSRNCSNLLLQLLQPSLRLESEKVNLPNRPFRTLVNYKNAKKIYFRVIRTSKEEIKKFDRRNYEKLWAQMVGLKAIRNWSIDMPDPQDFQAHAAEIKVDALPNGMYFIIASMEESFSLQKNLLARQLVYVSNISYVHNNENEYHVLHRETGRPLPNTSVQVWETRYNYNLAYNDEVKAESYTTDRNGYFKLAAPKAYRSFLLQLTTKTDELFLIKQLQQLLQR